MRQTQTLPDGTNWRDLNGNGVLDPYEDPRLSPSERVGDLLGRLSLEEKVGLMFQTVIETGEAGSLLESPGMISKSATSTVVLQKRMNHFNVHGLGTPRESARWANHLQELALQTPHGIPVTVSTDPRHAFTQNSGTSFLAAGFSQWPESLGLAAIDDLETIREFAAAARREYRAVGIHAALHPQIDLPTEPRWGRQIQTFGADPERVAEYVAAYLEGFQGAELGPTSVACTTKHFPGGGPQQGGEDAHFPYGREQVYPGGAFEAHLLPFRRAIELGTSAIMPYYGMPIGLRLDGAPVEAVGFGFNRQIITGLLREQLGFGGVVVTDWELLNDNPVGDQVLPARAWGVESLDVRGRMLKVLDAGADQFGGEECVDLLLDLVHDGLVPESRIDESARRLLLPKFQLGLFDDPFVDEDEAERIVGSPDFVRAGFNAQGEAVTVLENRVVGASGHPLLPLELHTTRRVYVEGVKAEAVAAIGVLEDDPSRADLAIVRIGAPYEPRDDLFLESFFHQGSLEFPPGLVHRLTAIAARTPLVLVMHLDRPGILTPFTDVASAILVEFGASDESLMEVLRGGITPRGTLPVEIPRSMDAVRASSEDLANDTVDPVYRYRSGLRLAAVGREPVQTGTVHS